MTSSTVSPKDFPDTLDGLAEETGETVDPDVGEKTANEVTSAVELSEYAAVITAPVKSNVSPAVNSLLFGWDVTVMPVNVMAVRLSVAVYVSP